MTSATTQTTFLGGVNPSISYEIEGENLIRTIISPNGKVVHRLPRKRHLGLDPRREWQAAYLMGEDPTPELPASGEDKAVRIVDLFCGVGGLSLGVHQASKAFGLKPKGLFAVDLDANALDVHAYNLRPRKTFNKSVRDLLKTEVLLGAHNPIDLDPSQVILPDWPKGLTEADVVIGGPPCQGHSNLNNRTRRSDPRNELYLWMAAAAHVVNAKVVIIENVPSVKSDAGEVVQRTQDLLDDLGYAVGFDGILAADAFGVAQTRRRHFLIAIRKDVLDHGSAVLTGRWLMEYGSDAPPMTAMDAIGDLANQEGQESDEFNLSSNLSEENRERVKWLIDNDEHNLPDSLRPDCHRTKEHNYGSVYGRMFGDRPAPTLSTGFLSPGRGRYVHPSRPRTLTPHEGARIQGFPDSFRFIGSSGTIPKRTQMSRMIGDAVPPPLAFHVALAGLWMLKENTF